MLAATNREMLFRVCGILVLLTGLVAMGSSHAIAGPSRSVLDIAQTASSGASGRVLVDHVTAMAPGAASAVQSQAANGGPPAAIVELRAETDFDRSEDTSTANTLKAVSELMAAIAWPMVFATLIITQRKGLSQLCWSLVDVIGKSTRIKIGELIDLEVDRSAREAMQVAAAAAPQTEVPEPLREAASRVDKLVGDGALPVIRRRMIDFAREYESTRANLKPGRDRTAAMNAILAKMRTLALAGKPLLHEFANDRTSPGARLTAIAILQLSPNLEYLPWLVERMRVEQPFVFFHASLALRAAVRAFGVGNASELKRAIEEALRIVRSFDGGPPDRNTVDTLEQALTELAAGRAVRGV